MGGDIYRNLEWGEGGFDGNIFMGCICWDFRMSFFYDSNQIFFIFKLDKFCRVLIFVFFIYLKLLLEGVGEVFLLVFWEFGMIWRFLLLLS